MKKVLELPVFRRLLAVTMITELALAIGSVALAVLVYRRTGSAIGAAAFFLCIEIGPALISPVFVSRVDQRSARIVLSVIYVIEAAIFALLAWIVGRFSLAAVLGLALIDGSLAVTARVLMRAAWTSITTPLGLMREANALVNTGFSVCFMVGPALGGAIVAASGARVALLVNVVLFAVSTLTVATAPGLPRPVTEPTPAAGRLRAAFRYAWSNTLIRRLLVLEAAAMLFFTISIPVEIVFAEHTLHAGAGGYGALLAVWGGGAIAGSAVYARWRDLPPRLLMTLGTCFLGAGFLIMAVAPDLGVAMVGAAIAGVGNGSQVVAMRTALQEALPAPWLALVLSLNETMFQAVPGLGIALGGAIAALAGARAALAAAAAGSLAVAVLMWTGIYDATQELQPPSEPALADSALSSATRRP